MKAYAVPNTNYSSPNNKPTSLLRALWKSIRINTGRLLVFCGGNLSRLGMKIIIKAESEG